MKHNAEKPKEYQNRSKWVLYVLSAALLTWYLVVLWQSFHPVVSEDYRRRYLEEGFFYDDVENDGSSAAGSEGK